MTNPGNSVFQRLYGRARRPEDLPWHRDEPPPLLARALDARGTPGDALDLGCGAGTYSLYLARRGWRVVGVDFMPQAVAMLEAQARQSGLDVSAVQADVTAWDPPRQFDLVLDVGCLHSLAPDQRPAYRRLVERALKPGGDYVLVHCGRRGWWDRWPIGPQRLSREQVVDLFAPVLELRAEDPEHLTSMPIFMGVRALVGRYWFTRCAAA